MQKAAGVSLTVEIFESYFNMRACIVFGKSPNIKCDWLNPVKDRVVAHTVERFFFVPQHNRTTHTVTDL